MRLALRDAHVEPGEIQYINAHGSSTPLNDPTETKAIKDVFGDAAYSLRVSGTKGYYGHALGASGAIEAAISALAIEREWLPPTVNLSIADEACDLNFLPGTGQGHRVEHGFSRCKGLPQDIAVRGLPERDWEVPRPDFSGTPGLAGAR